MPPVPRAYSARPTIQLDGQENLRLTELLTGMAMVERVGGLSSLELRLTNVASVTGGGAEEAFDAGDDLDLGKTVTAGAGDATAPTEIFRGSITAIEGRFDPDGPPQLAVLAEDGLQKARLKRRTRVFEHQTIAAIARQIAGEHGFTPQIHGLEQEFGTQVQMNESDLAFLRRLLARVDADLQLVGSELQISPRAEVRRGNLELSYGSGLRSARVVVDLAYQVTGTSIGGWDIRNGQALSADGDEQALGPGEGDKGGGRLESSFGERREHTGHLMSYNDSEARTLASAARNSRARRFLTVQGVAEGNPALRVGTHVKLDGLGEWFSNTYYVVIARHLFDLEEGYRTEFAAECAFLGT